MTTDAKPRRRSRIRRWWASGAPHRNDWQWVVWVGLAIMAGVVAVVIGFATVPSGQGDWSGRLFTYRHGRLDVDLGNVWLLTLGLGVVYRWCGPYRQDDS